MCSSNGRGREPLRRENPKLFDIRQIDNDMCDGLVKSPYYYLEKRTTPWEDTQKIVDFDIFKLDEVYYFNASDDRKHLIAKAQYRRRNPIYVELKGHRMTSKIIFGYIFMTTDHEIFMKLVFPRVETLMDVCWRTLKSHNLDVRPLLPKILCDEYDDVTRFYAAKRNYDKPPTSVHYHLTDLGYDMICYRFENRVDNMCLIPVYGKMRFSKLAHESMKYCGVKIIDN